MMNEDEKEYIQPINHHFVQFVLYMRDNEDFPFSTIKIKPDIPDVIFVRPATLSETEDRFERSEYIEK